MVLEAGGDPIPPDLRNSLIEPVAPAEDETPDHPEVGAAFEDVPESEHYDYIRQFSGDEVRLAAGSGTPVEREPVVDRVAFRRDWLCRQGLQAEKCSLVRVTGNSMEPTYIEGDMVLVDHSRVEPVDGRVFALRTRVGPLLKRLRMKDGGWMVYSDGRRPEYAPRPISEDDDIIGRVPWSLRMLDEAALEPTPLWPDVA